MGDGKELVEYRNALSPEQLAEFERSRDRKRDEYFKKRREEKALMIQQAKEAFANMFIPEVENPPKEAVEFVLESLKKRIPYKRIREAFPGIGEKAWKNLTSSSHKHMVSDPEQASLVLQKEAEVHERILRKRELMIRDQIKKFEANFPDKGIPEYLLQMLFDAQDKKMTVRSQSLLRAHTVGGLGGKKGKTNNNFMFKFNTPRPPKMKVVEAVAKAITDD